MRAANADVFLFLLLFLTISQWVIYAKVRSWWKRWRSREPEPKQGKPVDRVLWHFISDHDTPWDAGTSWERCGRGYIVALQRQGLGELLNERAVSDYKAAYTLGYTVREEEDRKEIEALSKRLERRESASDRLRAEVEELREKLAQRPAAAPTQQRKPSPTDPLSEALHEWGGCTDNLETIMQRKGWGRINPVSVAPVPVPDFDFEEPAIAEPETEPAQPEIDYTALKGTDRKQAMLELREKGLSNPEVANLFGVSVSCVKSTISVYKKQLQQSEPDEPEKEQESKIITFDFDGLKAVNEG